MKVSITFYIQFLNEGKRTTDYEGPRESLIVRVLRSVSIFSKIPFAVIEQRDKMYM